MGNFELPKRKKHSSTHTQNALQLYTFAINTVNSHWLRPPLFAFALQTQLMGNVNNQLYYPEWSWSFKPTDGKSRPTFLPRPFGAALFAVCRVCVRFFVGQRQLRNSPTTHIMRRAHASLKGKVTRNICCECDLSMPMCVCREVYYYYYYYGSWCNPNASDSVWSLGLLCAKGS